MLVTTFETHPDVVFDGVSVLSFTDEHLLFFASVTFALCDVAVVVVDITSVNW